MGIPERESALMPFRRLELIPGEYLVDYVGMVKPGVVTREGKLPEDSDGDQEQDGWAGDVGQVPDLPSESAPPPGQVGNLPHSLSHGSARCAFRQRSNRLNPTGGSTRLTVII